MSWVRRLNRITMALALMAWLSGCATTPEPRNEETAAAKEQAREEALHQAFGEAVEAMENGNNKSARKQFEALHESHPQRTGPLANLGILALETGNQAQAKARFKQVVALDSTHAAALNYLGVIARKNGEFEQAEARYREALAAEPDYLPAMMNLAILLDIYLGRPGEALPLYERYQSMAEEPNPRLKDWIFDAKNRI